MPNRQTHVTAQVPLELAEELRQIALEADRSLSAEIRRAFRRHVELELAGGHRGDPVPHRHPGDRGGRLA